MRMFTRIFTFTLRRLCSLMLSLLLASVVVFTVIEVIPGDPAAFMLGLEAQPDTLQALREELGLDVSAPRRYVNWVVGMLRGDFGVSYAYRSPVREIMAERLQVSLPLALYALALALLIAFPLGIIAATRYRSFTDFGVMALSQLGIALPNFWLGMLLVLFFSIKLGWFSAGGFEGWDAGFWRGMKSLTLPALSLALPQSMMLARLIRAALLDTIEADFVRTARAKGLSYRQAVHRHALHNALIPVLTLIGLQLSYLLAGAVIIENVFFLPGLGRLVFQGLMQRDLVLVENVVMLLVFAVLTINFLIDLVYGLVDPRLRRRP